VNTCWNLWTHTISSLMNDQITKMVLNNAKINICVTFAIPSLTSIFFHFQMKNCLSILHSSSQILSNVGVHSSKAHLTPPLKLLITIKNTYNLTQSISISRSTPIHQNTYNVSTSYHIAWSKHVLHWEVVGAPYMKP